MGDFDGASKSTFLVLFVAFDWRLGKVTNDFAERQKNWMRFCRK